MVLTKVTFKSLTSRLCKRDLSSLRALMAISAMFVEVWLVCDFHIHATQQLIQLQPDLQHIRGLQDPMFGQSLRFDIIHGEMVQILHSDGNHWITVSTISCTSPSTVQVYDSLGMALPLDTKKQITAILHSPGEEIKLGYANVQIHIDVKL